MPDVREGLLPAPIRRCSLPDDLLSLTTTILPIIMIQNYELLRYLRVLYSLTVTDLLSRNLVKIQPYVTK